LTGSILDLRCDCPEWCDALPSTALSNSNARWRDTLYSRLRARPDPLLILPRCTIPAASLWASVRLWTDFFRTHHLVPGDRVVLAIEPSIGSLAFLLAAIWEGLTVAIALPYRGSPELLDIFDARLGIGLCGLDADDPGCPLAPVGWQARAALGDPSPDARFITRTSGTSGSPTWVALSDDNLWSVLDAHQPHLSREGDIVLSILPWHHSFGLILDLLPALLNAAVILREPSGGRDPQSIIAAAQQWGVNYCSMVPLQAQRIAVTPGGLDMLRALRAGVVGGAPVSAQLAAKLASTNLRVGYGQTEASPGITLGEPGVWIPNALGSPRGCAIRTDPDGRLFVRGPNVAMGVWEHGRVRRLDPDRWLDTGDLVRVNGDRLIYLGRADNNFKLANGRIIDAAQLEHDLREAFPRAADAMVFSPDGQNLRVCLIADSADFTPNPDTVRRVLGPLADRIDSITILTEDARIRTPKGALDRRTLAAA